MLNEPGNLPEILTSRSSVGQSAWLLQVPKEAGGPDPGDYAEDLFPRNALPGAQAVRNGPARAFCCFSLIEEAGIRTAGHV